MGVKQSLLSKLLRAIRSKMFCQLLVDSLASNFLLLDQSELDKPINDDSLS